MPHAVSMAATGLQAIILCGPGSSFPTFTTNPDENPKALLSIANRPMVWYPIDFCYRTGITNITLICPPSAADAMTAALNTNPFLTSLPHPRPDLVAPHDLDYNTGTAEILRLPEIRDIVKCDLLVLPCDLVCEIGGDKLLQAWLVKAASLDDLLSNEAAPHRSGGLGVWYETKTANPVKGEETDFIATTPVPKSLTTPANSILQRLSYLKLSMPTDSYKDLVEEKNNYPLRHGLSRSLSKLRVLTTHRDAHIYFLPKWIMDFVQENEKLETIGEDVVGWWAKATWQTGLPEKLGLAKVLQGRVAETGLGDSTREDSPSPQGVLSKSRDSSFAADPEEAHSSLLNQSPRASVPPVLAYIHPSGPDAPLLRRVDTAQLLLAVSLRLAKLPAIEETGPDAASPFAHPKKVAYPDGVKPRTTITRQDCLIANNVMVDEKTSIKECVVGANCQIKEGAKLFQCLLMNDVVVEKGCKLTRCILGKRSVIGEGSTLTDCEVQEHLLVEPQTDDKDNKLMSSSGLEASEQDMQDVLQEFDDDAGNNTAFG
ncbi:nucleotide-diphospho-sugar transferase [Astrocystis sublimbata]|nr:nucleotide-diphospho-sugar transferase [Astrocystis sublimbata]